MSKLVTPTVIVNFKVYEEVVGRRSLNMAMICQEVSESSGVCIAVCPPTVELSSVAAGVHIPVLAQHVDSKAPGSNTGWITPQSVAGGRAVGTLLNHSEHRVPRENLRDLVKLCRDASLETVVCADTEAAAADFAAFHPDFIAVEPPELIGGEISVTQARPEVVENAVRSVRGVDSGIPVFCGAGVKSGEDVTKALELGASGVLLASGVVKAKDARSALEDLVKGV